MSSKTPISFTDLEDDEAFWSEQARGLQSEHNDEILNELSGGTGISQATVARYTEDCTKCRGSGSFYAYSGRYVGPCFYCKGEGKRHFKTSPEARRDTRARAAKRKVAKAEEALTAAQLWKSQHEAEAAYIDKRARDWDFMSSLQQALAKWGHLTEKQLSAVQKCIAKDAERDAARKQKEVKDGLDLTELPAGRYAVPGGDTRLKIRIDVVTKPGKWEGWIFVKDAAAYGEGERYGSQRPDGLYRGKIVPQLKTILEDPKAAMAEYGHLTGSCGVCNRPLEDEESVARGIGPVCLAKMG